MAVPGLWLESMILRIFSTLHDSVLFLYKAGICKGRNFDHFVAFYFCYLLKYGITYKSCETGVLCSTAPVPSPEVEVQCSTPITCFFLHPNNPPRAVCEVSAGGVRAHQEQQSWNKTAFLMEKMLHLPTLPQIQIITFIQPEN